MPANTRSRKSTTRKTTPPTNLAEALAAAEDASGLRFEGNKRDHEEVLASERLELAKAILRVKQLLFNRNPHEVLYTYGRENVERMVRFLQQAKAQIRDNGWQYHIPQPYQEEFHRSEKRHRCIFGGNRCLPEGTKVLMADWSWRNIGKINEGDFVQTDTGCMTAPCRVVKVFPPERMRTLKITLAGGQSLNCSPNHRFPVYRYSKDLRLNDEYAGSATMTAEAMRDSLPHACVFLRTIYHDLERVVSVEDSGLDEICIDLTVDSADSTFIVEYGIITHNSGKTIGGVYEATCFAMGHHPYKPKLFIPPNAKIMVAGQSMKTVRETINPYLFSFLPQRKIRGIKYLRNDVIDFIELDGGRKIVFASYDQGRKRFQGFSCFAYHLDEEPPEDIYQEVLMRLIDTKGYLWMTLTPLSGLTWVYYTLYQNPDEDPEYEDYHWHTEDNLTIDQDEVNRVFEKLPEDIRRARARGEFIGASGIVYPWLQADLAYCQPFKIPEHWQLFRVIDPSAAGTTAVLWCALDPYSNIWAYREYYVKGRSVSEHCRHIRQASGTESYTFDLIDGQALAAAGGNTLETVYHQYLEHLYEGCYTRNPLVPMTDKKIEDGIYSVWEYMKEAEKYVAGIDTERPYLRIFADLLNFRNEARRYRWQILQSGPAKGASTNKPVGKDDHLMDCLRYACHYRPRFQYSGYTPPKHGYRYRDPVTNY